VKAPGGPTCDECADARPRRPPAPHCRRRTAAENAAAHDSELLQPQGHAVEHGEGCRCQCSASASVSAALQGAEPRPCCTQGLVVVPQQTAYVVEKFGKFQTVLEPGLNFLIPLVHRIPYVYSLKEEALSVPSQVRLTALLLPRVLRGTLARLS
jgi:hypothetical protein